MDGDSTSAGGAQAEQRARRSDAPGAFVLAKIGRFPYVDAMATHDAPRRSRFAQYTLRYTVYGCDLDADDLISEARPQSEFMVWRKGDELKPGEPMDTSGIGIQFFSTNDNRNLGSAIEAFLEKEDCFLRASGKRTGKSLWSILSCRIFVYSATQGKLWLAPSILARLGELGVEFEVDAYPCSDREDE